MTDKLEQLTESLWLKLTNRVAGIIMAPLGAWCLHVLVQMHDDNIAYANRLAAHDQQIANHEIRIDNLEGGSRHADISVENWK